MPNVATLRNDTIVVAPVVDHLPEYNDGRERPLRQGERYRPGPGTRGR